MSHDEQPLGLAAIIAEDWRANGRDWTRPGFRALAVHRFGVWRMTIKWRLARAPLSVLYRTLERRVRNHYGIELPYSVSVGRRVVIEHQGAIVVHGDSVIGDECTLRQGVTLGNRSREHPLEAPTLGVGVDIGAGAKLLGPIQVGDRAVIGANAVVLTDVPAGHLAVGVPATVRPRAAREGA
ncbi:MAG: serine O-acetyltransferase [Phycisphaerales bacterium]